MKKEYEDLFLDCEPSDLGIIGIKPHGIEFGQREHEEAYEKTMEITRPECSHPLLNADSKHYEMVGGMEAIEIMESIFTVEELKAWAKLTAMKYRLRIGKKDDPTKEIKKIKTFEDYYQYLDNLPTSVDSLP